MPPHRKGYRMSQEELDATKKYLDDKLPNGMVKSSTSPIASLVILVKKPGGGLRFYVDYRALNAVTIKKQITPYYGSKTC